MEATVHGAAVHAERLGEGSRRVLLLHGWGADISLMRPVAEKLTGCDCLMIDFPGFGKSGRPPEPWGVPDYAAAVRELLEQTGFAPCAVIAHSFGCRVAIQLASEKPELFTKLILTGAAGLRDRPTPEQQKRATQYKKLRAMAEAVQKLPLLGGAAKSWQDRLRRKYGSADYNALDEEMRKTFVKVVNLDLSSRLPLIQQPTLLVFGDLDDQTPLRMGQRMEELIPDAGLVTLKGGTHFAYLEQLPAFVTIAQHFLTEE